MSRPAVLLVLTLLVRDCSGPDMEQQAQQRLREDVELAGTAVRDVLASDSQSRERAQAALDRALGFAAVVAGLATGSGTGSAQVVVTVTEKGGGVGYSAWTSRACVDFALEDGADLATRIFLALPRSRPTRDLRMRCSQ